MKNLSQHIAESFQSSNNVSEAAEKDWMRMADLYLNDKSGESVAKSIKDKSKAIARYITGVKIAGEPCIPNKGEFYSNGRMFDSGQFAAFYNKAIELGATQEEIITEYNKLGAIPANIEEKISIFAAKNMGSWIIGDLSKAVHKAGFDMTLSKGGNAKTMAGKDAMGRNGCKWTIGYVATIKNKDKDFTLEFDAITDEGVNNNTIRYVWNHNSILKSDNIQTDYKAYNKTLFIQQFINELQLHQ